MLGVAYRLFTRGLPMVCEIMPEGVREVTLPEETLKRLGLLLCTSKLGRFADVVELGAAAAWGSLELQSQGTQYW